MKKGTTLFCIGCLLLIGFLLYVFACTHQFPISGKNWEKLFRTYGIDPSNISHDESMWYYKGKSTCVFYTDSSKECPLYTRYCPGASHEAQVRAIREAINNGGEHPKCPLIYPSLPVN